MKKKTTAFTLTVALTLALGLMVITVGRTMAGDGAPASPDTKREQISTVNTISSIEEAPPLPLFCGTSSLYNYSSAPAAAIADNTTITDTIDVSGVTEAYIFDVDVTVDISHTFAADLELVLISPAGTRVTLTTDNGGGNNDVFIGTLFDNDADIPVTDYTYSDGVPVPTVAPEGTFFALLGEDPNGTWTMELTDDAGGDQGTFNSWELDITAMTEMPTIVNTYGISATVGAPINDNSTISGTLDIDSGTDTYLWNVELYLDINHTFAGDLEMTLESPAGTVSTISTDNGGGADDVFAGTTFTDHDGELVTDYIYTSGVVVPLLVPEEGMASFMSEDPNGTWTFELTDDAGGDQGTLNSWGVTVTTAACAPTDVALTGFDGGAGGFNGFLPLLGLFSVAVVALGGFVLRRRSVA